MKVKYVQIRNLDHYLQRNENKYKRFQVAIVAMAMMAMFQVTCFYIFGNMQKSGNTLSSELHNTIRDRVHKVDEQLRKLSEVESSIHKANPNFVHPYFNGTSFTEKLGPSMKSAGDLLFATKLSIDVRNPCGGAASLGKHLALVVFIYIRAADFKLREQIRSTYGFGLKRHPRAEMYFIMAKHDEPKIQEQIIAESQQHNDFIQVDYGEAYFNCTIQGVAMLRWTALNCPFAKYMLKLDDDSYIRLNPLLTELDARKNTQSILGAKRSHDPVIRDPQIKWYISPQYYPYEYYPDHIAGLYFIPANLTVQLYEAIVSEPRLDTIPALPIDDVYITGILAAKINISVEHSGSVLFLDYLANEWNNLDKHKELGKYNTFIDMKNMEYSLEWFWSHFGEN